MTTRAHKKLLSFSPTEMTALRLRAHDEHVTTTALILRYVREGLARDAEAKKGEGRRGRGMIRIRIANRPEEPTLWEGVLPERSVEKLRL